MVNKIIKEDLAYIISRDLPWDNLKDCCVLLTGANGFIPSYILHTLLYLNDVKKLNINVLALVRNKEKALKKFEDYANRDDLKFIFQDVCENIVTKEKIDYIFHAASQASPKFYGKDPVGTLTPNVIGTHNLLNLASKDKTKGFLFLSSGEVYGQVDKIPTSEGDYGYVDPINLRSCYAEAKRMGENMCVSWHQQYNVPAYIVRPFHTYGPGIDLSDGRVFADFIADVVGNRDIILKSDGSATRAFCYIADAVVGFFTVLFKGQCATAYNVGSDVEISMLDLAQVLIRLFPKKGLKIIKQIDKNGSGNYMKSPISRACPNISKLKLLGWSPSFSIETGFERTIRSFEE